MDPATWVAIAGVAAKAIGGGSSSPSAPISSGAQNGSYSGFDSSGWNVNTGLSFGQSAGASSAMLPLIIGGVVLLLLLKKKS